MWQRYIDQNPDERYGRKCQAIQWQGQGDFVANGAQVYVEPGEWVVRYRVGKGWKYTAFRDMPFTRRFIADTDDAGP